MQEKHLLAALDRFAQFFIKPLMKKDAITREREAVESGMHWRETRINFSFNIISDNIDFIHTEFQMALPSDFSRKEQLFSSFARPNHPVTKFSWGNLVTLRDNVSDENLYEELHKFRERHYSAHRMKLSIQVSIVLRRSRMQCWTYIM